MKDTLNRFCNHTCSVLLLPMQHICHKVITIKRLRRMELKGRSKWWFLNHFVMFVSERNYIDRVCFAYYLYILYYIIMSFYTACLKRNMNRERPIIKSWATPMPTYEYQTWTTINPNTIIKSPNVICFFEIVHNKKLIDGCEWKTVGNIISCELHTANFIRRIQIL